MIKNIFEIMQHGEFEKKKLIFSAKLNFIFAYAIF
jgi:hypothetical protein